MKKAMLTQAAWHLKIETAASKQYELQLSLLQCFQVGFHGGVISPQEFVG